MTVSELEDLEGEEPIENRGYYRIKFRPEGQLFTASFDNQELEKGNVVMVNTDHGLEPAQVFGLAPLCGCRCSEHKVNYEIARFARDSEREKYDHLGESEDRAFAICNTLIDKHKLQMHLVRVERFFNGSKMIFYFTADSRVDFRALVKDLVQEFRTRVEMRQVGVRHETKMIGGLGTCGRELCCSSFINKFDSVSIKMAKEQDLPLNPTKISGVCNRLLCCLTYEYDNYKKKRKSMPKVGRQIKIKGEQFLVKRQMVLQDMLVVENAKGDELALPKNEWRSFQTVKRDSSDKKKARKSDES